MEWIKLFSSAEQAELQVREGKPRRLVVRGLRLCIARHQGKLFVVSDSCPHSGAALSDGVVNYLGDVVCPLHQYQFSLRTGRERSERCTDLTCYPVEEKADGIFLGL